MKEAVQRRAAELGFDACRVTSAAPPESAPRLLDAIAEGRHGEMAWIARNAEKRVAPDKVLPGIRSVVALAASYHGGAAADGGSAGDPSASGKTGTVARYARHADYHDVPAGPFRPFGGFLPAPGGPGARGGW